MAQSEPVTDVLMMTCLTAVESQRLNTRRRSLVVMQTEPGGAIYELVMLEQRWLLLFHVSPTEVCIVDQVSMVDINPNLRSHIPD